MSREFLPGQVIAYPYLWAWQHEHGETEGRKTRPDRVVVAVRDANDGLTHLALLAFTTQPPQAIGSPWKFLISSAGGQALATASAARSLSTNTITMSPNDPDTSGRTSKRLHRPAHRDIAVLIAGMVSAVVSTCRRERPRPSASRQHVLVIPAGVSISTRLDKLAFLEKCVHISH